jgi:hypothetical protein
LVWSLALVSYSVLVGDVVRRVWRRDLPTMSAFAITAAAVDSVPGTLTVPVRLTAGAIVRLVDDFRTPQVYFWIAPADPRFALPAKLPDPAPVGQRGEWLGHDVRRPDSSRVGPRIGKRREVYAEQTSMVRCLQ